MQKSYASTKNFEISEYFGRRLFSLVNFHGTTIDKDKSLNHFIL
jgi:hypothetical protein